MSKKNILVILLVFLIIKVSMGQEDVQEGIPLLKNYALAHKDIQLNDSIKNLIGYENIDYVSSFSNCRTYIVSELNSWLRRDNIVSKSFENETNRVRITTDFDSPVNGEIIIIYRIYPKKQIAYLNIMIDSPQVINNRDREFLVRTYHLIELKENLISSMKCE